METVVEPLEGNKIKLSVTIDEQEFEKALDATYRKIARDARIPGFRPGKAPRRILEARLGKETARAEAIRGSLAEYYNEAIREQDVDAIAPPQIDITAGEQDGPLSFDAIVEVRPQVQLAGYGGLRVTIPSPVLTEDEVQVQVDRLRNNFGELVPVGRPARNGDHVTIDLKIRRPGDVDPESGTTSEDILYEVGSGNFGPELDDHLLGAKVGDIFQFAADLSGPQPDGRAGADEDAAVATTRAQLNYDVLVKDVKEMVLPEVTDEWASEASEFETVAELRADIEKRLTLVKRAQAQVALRSQAIEAVAELVQEDPPEPLVNDEVTHRAQEFENALRQQGLNLGQYLGATGRSQQQLLDELRTQAVQAVKADLALRAVADLEDIGVTEAEVDAEIVRLADRFETKPAQVRKQLESTEQMAAVRSDVRRGKAVEWLVEHLEAVDPQGQLIDRAMLEEAPQPDTEDPLPGAQDVAEDTEVTA
ncbi:MAG: trigger factor [Actinomycetota bacterium]|nr:trigger factor [Actinomycetota bacterium]